MYETYWRLHSNPFTNVARQGIFYNAWGHQEAVSRLLYGIKNHRGGILLTGPVGTGKTTILQTTMDTLDPASINLIHLTHVPHTCDELYFAVLHHLGQPKPPSRLEGLYAMTEHLRTHAKQGQTNLLIIDEAQSISSEAVLEELRMLLNLTYEGQFLLSVILAGLPELAHRINQSPSFAQRVGVRYELKPFDEIETESYLRYRLVSAGAEERPIFAETTIPMIHQASGGSARMINTIADLCLLVGFMNKVSHVDPDLVEKVLADIHASGQPVASTENPASLTPRH